MTALTRFKEDATAKDKDLSAQHSRQSEILAQAQDDNREHAMKLAALESDHSVMQTVRSFHPLIPAFAPFFKDAHLSSTHLNCAAPSHAHEMVSFVKLH